ncbi:DUF4012 domain-containing protein [Leifsonia sp. Leaf264]|uniref:DUF4012 domain-containing protein n=1 Tax=Leifsonia sp. Leaf264 TaxID=1736314 RepID=UPI00138F1533|nr:DUF4012 domain-containing protein [Leifsonia sp. Leaf264]
MAASVDTVAQGAVRPLSNLAGSIQLGDFKPVDGRIDLDPLIAAQPDLAAADATISQASTDIRSIDDLDVIGPLADARDSYEAQLADAASAIGGLDRAAQLVPAMLGADGARNYLMLFQNNAELRSSGGIPGALALIHTDDGAFAMTEQASSSDFPHYDAPVIELPTDVRAIWGENTAEYIQDVGYTPQFPLTGQIAREMWKRQFGTEVDGVIATDPVMLSYLLEATGPVTLPSGDVITSENAVQLLLSDVYARYENPADQDAFFASAAAAVFAAVASGDADPKKLIDAFIRAGDERRVLVWSSHDDDQEILEGTTLAGELPSSAGSASRFGLYFDDQTASKMDTYLDMEVAMGDVVCRKDERPYYELHVKLTNTAPADAATTLPEYVTGGGLKGVAAGNISTSVAAYAPPGSYNLGALRDGKDSGYYPSIENGYPLSKFSTELAPGESTTLTFGFLGDDPSKRGAGLEMTPMLRNVPVNRLPLTCENAVL